MKKERSLYGLDRFFLWAFALMAGGVAALALLTYEAWPLKLVSVGCGLRMRAQGWK